jgi:predicted permease
MRPIWLDAWPPFPGTSKQQVENLRIVPVARPLQGDMVGGVASMLWVLMGAIGAVLVIACANIANLMLVRADARRTEFAVRAALGAAPSRIARELLLESFAIGLSGAVFGLLLANGGLHFLVAMGPSDLPRLNEIAVHPQVLAFTMAVSLASTLLFGSVTALTQSLHADAPMSGAARGANATRERNATRSTLVVVQVALAVTLVVSAALMIRTYQALRDVNAGFSDPATIQTARIWIPTGEFRDPKQYTRMEHEILDSIAALPGVSSAGFASELPMESSGNNGPIAVEGQTASPGQPVRGRKWKFVSPGYVGTMGTRILAGRDVAWSDIEAGGRVALVSEALAREIAGDPAGALGKRIRLAPFPRDDWHEVVGVVEDVHHDGLSAAAPDTVYWPALVENMFSQTFVGTPSISFAIRSTRAGTIALSEEIRSAVHSTSASIPVGSERTMRDYYAASLSRTSFTLVLLAIAGAMALSLGVIGIYGVIAYVVQQKTREIGIRSALGARPEHLTRMFLVRGLALSGLGALVGLLAAAALGRLMSSLLFGVRGLDGTAFGVALAVTAAAAALASSLPARRAATIDPMETLKSD